MENAKWMNVAFVISGSQSDGEPKGRGGLTLLGSHRLERSRQLDHLPTGLGFSCRLQHPRQLDGHSPVSCKFFGKRRLLDLFGLSTNARPACSTVTQEVEAASEIVWSDRNGTYQLELTLPYANAKYNVSVWARSFSANVSDPRFWSIPAWRVIQTEADSTKSVDLNLSLSNSFGLMRRCRRYVLFISPLLSDVET